jgi:phytoene/squalene synthetase
MNNEGYQIISLQSAILSSEKIARKRSTKAWLMACILIPRNRRRYLFLCYAYLRWVDNFVDDKTKSGAEKKRFVENQKTLISDLSNRRAAKPNSEGEVLLYYFIEYALNEKDSNLIEYLNMMIDALCMDVERFDKDGIFSEEELSIYISLLNNSMFNIVHSFLVPKNNSQNSYDGLGLFLWYAGTFRDYYKDLESGLINISREDLTNYKINNFSLYDDENFRLWIKDKVTYVLNLLNDEIFLLKLLPLKIRFFWAFAYPFYLHKIIRIKTYSYNYNYLYRKDFAKEIKTYLETIVTGTKTVLKILI